MANPFDAALPSVGQKPWTLNPAILELRERQGTVEDVINTGRLSASGLADEIAEAAASVEVNDATVASAVSDPGSDTNAALVGQVGDLDSPVGAELATVISSQSAADMANPETELNSATVALIEESLGGGVSGLTRVEKGTLTNINTARPTWSGIVEWWVNEGETPTNIADGDLIVEVSSEPLPDVLVAQDSFTRSDGALGSTPVGAKAWEVLLPAGADGTFGVVSNQMALTGGTTGRALAVIDAGYSRIRTTITLSVSPNRQSAAAFRVVDALNFYALVRVSSTDGHYRLVKYTAGSASAAIKVFTATITNGDIVEIDDRISGALKIYVNTVLQFDESVDGTLDYSTATKVGANVASVASGTGAAGARWDEFSVYRPA